MKRFLCWCIKAAAAGALALGLLCLWCTFYYNVPVHYQNPTGATEYVWEADSFYRKGTEGFAFGRTNNEGFNDLEDYHEGDEIDILLMGSSHMEAMNVDQDQNAAAVLQSLLGGDRRVYNIGTSGHTLAYCLSNLPAALETYGPEGYVVIETRTLDFSDGELVLLTEGKLPSIESHTGGLIELLQKLPFLRLMYTKYLDDLDLGGGGDDRPQETTAPQQEVEEQEGMDQILARALAPAAESCREAGVELMIVYDPTVYVDDRGQPYTTTAPEDLERMLRCCREAGICFVDLTESYLDLYRDQDRLPYGFYNTSPGSGHMNRWGHELFSREVYRALEGGEG